MCISKKKKKKLCISKHNSNIVQVISLSCFYVLVRLSTNSPASRFLIARECVVRRRRSRTQSDLPHYEIRNLKKNYKKRRKD